MNSSARVDIHLLAGAYALDALDALERQRFEQHLATCASCQEDVASFAGVTGDLARGADELPPPSLRAEVLAEVDRVRQVSPAWGNTATRLRGAKGLLAVAAAIILVAMTGAIVRQGHTNSQLADRVALLEAPDTRMARLNGPDGSVRVVFSAAEGQGILVANDLAPAPGDHTYELWVITGGTPEKAALFQTDAKHHAVVLIDRIPPAGSFLAVTEEPHGGSPAPTTKPSLVSETI